MHYGRCLIALILLCLVPTWAAGVCSSAQLNTELTTDPASLGYGPYRDAGNDAMLVQLLNQVQPGASYIVSKGLVTTSSQRGVWGDVIFLVDLMADSPTKTKWQSIINKLLLPFDMIDYTDPFTAAYFANMVVDELQVLDDGIPRDIMNSDITTRTTRQGSRAEVVCGPNTVISQEDISLALRGVQ